MPHLDEGLLMALLDGELTGTEQQEAELHLQSCAECSTRVKELEGFMQEADGLVSDLVVPPVSSPPAPVAERRARHLSPQTLAWAASIVAALGLGYAGSTLLNSNDRGPTLATREAERSVDAPTTQEAPLSPPTTPQAALSEERAPQPTAGGAGVATRSTTEGLVRREADNANTPSNASTVIRPNAAEIGQNGAAGEQEAAGVASISRDTVRPTEQQAKLADFARAQRSESDRRQAPALQALAPRDEVTTRQRLEGLSGASDRSFRSISMEDAVRQLGGVILLIDGLTPEEFSVAVADGGRPRVQVLYRVGPTETRLVLEQHRIDNSFVASDLQTQAQTVTQGPVDNLLSWNDLRGFALTLTGPFSPDSLFHFKTLVK